MFWKRRTARPDANSLPAIRPLDRRMDDPPDGAVLTTESLTALLEGPIGEALCTYFRDYPATSGMGEKNRALLFLLMRLLRPHTVGEIGTGRGGGAEVMTRALWENSAGVLLTADPYSANDVEPILAGWPAALRERIRFHALNSMEFLSRLQNQRIVLDLVLIDGDHDYEPVLFDLQATAKLMRPGGIVVLNDAVQIGPFQAARTFLAANPAWRELGPALAAYDEASPFTSQRASQPGTGFTLLQAPDHWSITAMPRSWGQLPTPLATVDALSFELPAQVAAGTLHYQAILRRFGGGPPRETKAVGALTIRCDGAPATIVHELPARLAVVADAADVNGTFEIALSWQAEPGSPPLALAAIPTPLLVA
jgi:predicted O-methyltransferase YrrM